MKYSIILLVVICLPGRASAQNQIKILFDCTKAETAGNADWTIDADQHNMDWKPNGCTGCGGSESNPGRFPTPAQSGINANTAETYWNGSLSSWGIDCVKRGYSVESLPYTGQITFGSTSNPQDLSNYQVFVVDEPNILFTAAEKTALINFVYSGGSLFMVSDHDQSDRNNDGYDSPAIWNDFIASNGLYNNKTGFSFDLANFSQTSTNIPNLPTDSIINGPMGAVTEVKWTSGTSMTLHATQNPTVRGVVFKTGSSTSGSTGVLCAYARLGCGKIAAISDSSPTDDGTGDPNDQLYNGYTLDANGNHRKLLMNMTIWLAAGPCNNATGVDEAGALGSLAVFPNPAADAFWLRFDGGDTPPEIRIYDESGVFMAVKYERETGTDLVKIPTSGWPNGIYYVVLTAAGKVVGKAVSLQR